MDAAEIGHDGAAIIDVRADLGVLSRARDHFEFLTEVAATEFELLGDSFVLRG